jgi:hypothetical protein
MRTDPCRRFTFGLTIENTISIPVDNGRPLIALLGHTLIW